MRQAEISNLTLLEISKRIKVRSISSVEVTEALLTRVTTIDNQLGSYVVVTAEHALQAAAAADREIAAGNYRGPLQGVPVAVKDLCYMKGVPTAAGMPIYKSFIPDIDATAVSRLKMAGAVILGKLQMTEGAFAAHHPSVRAPVNPWGDAYWTGVSSSGSGVALAARLCYGSLGTDTLGSIRFPSSMNGITGLKPTWGRVSRAGLFALAESLDHLGPMTRSAADTAAMLAVIAGLDSRDPTAVPCSVPDYLATIANGVRGVRIGIDRALIADGTDAITNRILEEACEVFSGLGADVRNISFPSPDEVTADAMILCAAEAAVAHECMFPKREGEYGPVLATLLTTGRMVDGFTLVKLQRRRAVFCGLLAELFRDIDLLLMPAMDVAAPTLEYLATRTGDPKARHSRIRFTAPFNMTGSPCLTLPGGVTHEGMPVGFQIVGRHLDEDLVLRAGHAFQQVTRWHIQRPRSQAQPVPRDE